MVVGGSVSHFGDHQIRHSQRKSISIVVKNETQQIVFLSDFNLVDGMMIARCHREVKSRPWMMSFDKHLWEQIQSIISRLKFERQTIFPFAWNAESKTMNKLLNVKRVFQSKLMRT